jgi:hypothetical protein
MFSKITSITVPIFTLVLAPMMLMSLGARLSGSQVVDAWLGVQSGVLILIVSLAAVFLTLWLECI